MNRSLRRSIALSVTPALALYTCFFVVPLAVLLYTSFTDWGRAPFLTYVGTTNYRSLLSDQAFLYSLQNGAIWSGVSIFLHIPLSVVVAMVLAKHIRGWKVFRAVYFFPNMISWAALGLIYKHIVFNPTFGLVNGILRRVGLDDLTRVWLADPQLALAAVMSTWVFNIGLWTIVVMSEIVTIPSQIYEAAEIDGASPRQQDVFITIPLLRNVIGTAMTLSIASGLRSFAGVYLMTSGGPGYSTTLLSLQLYEKYSVSQFGMANAIGVVLILLGLALTLGIRWAFRTGEAS